MTKGGGCGYVASISPGTLDLGNIPLGGSKSGSVTVTTNNSWITASAGTEIKIEATVTNEDSRPDHTIGRRDTGTATHPGGCYTPPTSTPTEPQKENTPTPTATKTKPKEEDTPTPTPIKTKPGDPTSTPTPTPTATEEKADTPTPTVTFTPTVTLTPPTGVPPASTPQAEICPQWIIFHTFRDGDLEVYRLDGVEGEPDATLINLSKGPDSVDNRPSRSPNDAWVAFQTDRDGNNEIYYTDSGGGSQIRLTDVRSNEINPMYGPDNSSIVYQSDRNGNWDLFMIDMNTGEEVQLPSLESDDINLLKVALLERINSWMIPKIVFDDILTITSSSRKIYRPCGRGQVVRHQPSKLTSTGSNPVARFQILVTP